jgi:hypothetical protein
MNGLEKYADTTGREARRSDRIKANCKRRRMALSACQDAMQKTP